MSAPIIDAELVRAVRRTGYMRQGFYAVVLITALAGQVSGAEEALGIPLLAAIPAVGSLELGGVVVLANADVRRRLGEHATASRVLSAGIAVGAVAFNWLAHTNHLLGGFFAGMSALGYLVWLMHTGNQRRDRLRAKGDLPPTSPVYGLWQWARHPWLTRRARSLAKQNVRLGLYGSLAAARAQKLAERRHGAISKVLHRKIRSAVDPATADIAVAVYDLDRIAVELADGADYPGLTRLIAVDLEPTRMLPTAPEGTGVTTVRVSPDQPIGTDVPAAIAATPEPIVATVAAIRPTGRDGADELDVLPGLFDEPVFSIADLTTSGTWTNVPAAASGDVPVPIPTDQPVARTRPATRARTSLGRHGRLRVGVRQVRPEPATEVPAGPLSEPETVPVEEPPKRRMPQSDRTIRARLRNPDRVPRRPDGTVPIRSVKSMFGVSQPRATKLLQAEGLHRTSDNGQPADDDPINGVDLSPVGGTR